MPQLCLGHTPLLENLKSLPDHISCALVVSLFSFFFQLTHNTVFHPNMIPNFVNMLFSLAGLTWYNGFKPVVWALMKKVFVVHGYLDTRTLCIDFHCIKQDFVFNDMHFIQFYGKFKQIKFHFVCLLQSVYLRNFLGSQSGPNEHFLILYFF